MYSQVVGNALIVALRNEKGSYNDKIKRRIKRKIVALRNEKGSYNVSNCHFI